FSAHRSTALFEKSRPNEGFSVHGASPMKHLFDVHPVFIVPEQLGRDMETLKRVQRATIANGLPGNDGVPASLLQPFPYSSAQHEVHSGKIHDREIAAIVHVSEHIKVVWEHMKSFVRGAPQFQLSALRDGEHHDE